MSKGSTGVQVTGAFMTRTGVRCVLRHKYMWTMGVM